MLQFAKIVALIFIFKTMAKRYKNEKGFLVIEMSYEEAKNVCGFGIKHLNKETKREIGHNILCDTCNVNIEDNVYYVAAINRALCKECCDDFIDNINRYKEDIPYEVKYYNHYALKLGMTELASVQANDVA